MLIALPGLTEFLSLIQERDASLPADTLAGP